MTQYFYQYRKYIYELKSTESIKINEIYLKYLSPALYANHIWKYLSGAQFTYCGVSPNKLMKIINGNRRLGYKLAVWNCRRGLITEEKEASNKMQEVKDFAQSHKFAHVLYC